MLLFKEALEECQVSERDQDEFILYLISFQESIVAGPDDGGEMQTPNQVKKHPVFQRVVAGLVEKIEQVESLGEFVDPNSVKHRDMLDRVACLLSTMRQDEFGITDEEME